MEAHFLPDDTAETDANFIAEKIEQLVAAGEPVREGSATRPVRYEDCCILLAARGDFPAYAEALTARGIPVYADARENLLDAPHIRPLIALLRVIDNPAQDIYLAAAMLGPMFGFTDDDLVRLRALQRKTSLYGAVLAAQCCSAERREDNAFTRKAAGFLCPPDGPAPDGPERAGGGTAGRNFCFHRLSGGAGRYGKRHPPPGGRPAVCGVLRQRGRQRHLGAGACHRRGGAGRFYRAGHCARRCAAWLCDHHDHPPLQGIAVPGGVFGGHGPAVQCRRHPPAGAAPPGGRRGTPPPARGGEGAYKTAAYAALANVHEQEMRSEQMRLLYVALTRAQDELILTVPLGMTKTTNPFAKAAAFLTAGAGETLHQQAACFADWLRAALLVHPCGGPLRRLAENLELPFVDTRSTIAVTVHDAPAEAAEPETTEEILETASADPALVETLRAGFAWQYPTAALAGVPAKVSVTSIVHKQEQTTLERPAFLSKDGLTAAEMGTALHAFLEHADFAALAAGLAGGGDTLAEAIRTERQRQVEAKLTPPEIAGKLDVSKIRRFVESEAFARIRAAKQVLRELDFITALPASAVLAAQGSARPQADSAAAQARVLVQGIADLVLVFDDHIEEGEGSQEEPESGRGQRRPAFRSILTPTTSTPS